MGLESPNFQSTRSFAGRNGAFQAIGNSVANAMEVRGIGVSVSGVERLIQTFNGPGALDMWGVILNTTDLGTLSFRFVVDGADAYNDSAAPATSSGTIGQGIFIVGTHFANANATFESRRVFWRQQLQIFCTQQFSVNNQYNMLWLMQFFK